MSKKIEVIKVFLFGAEKTIYIHITNYCCGGAG